MAGRGDTSCFEELHEKDEKISDIYDFENWDEAEKGNIISLVNKFTDNYGTLGILNGIINPILMLELPLYFTEDEDLEMLKRHKVPTPEDYVLRKYRLDTSSPGLYTDKNLYVLNTKYLQKYFPDHITIREDILSFSSKEYGCNYKGLRLKELMGRFFPMESVGFDISDRLNKCDDFITPYAYLYHEPLRLFLLCAKLYSLFFTGVYSGLTFYISSIPSKPLVKSDKYNKMIVHN